MKNNKKIINIEIFKDNEMEKPTSFTYNDLVNLGEQIESELGYYKTRKDIFKNNNTTYLTFIIEGEK